MCGHPGAAGRIPRTGRFRWRWLPASLAALALAAALARAAEQNVGLLAYGGAASCQGCNYGSFRDGFETCYGPEVVFDGVVERRSGCSYGPNFIRSWPEAVSVSAVRFLGFGDLGYPPSYALYASEDGTNWTVLAQGVALQNQWTTVTFPRVNTKHLKLYLGSPVNWVYAREVEVLGQRACSAGDGCASVEATVGEELGLVLSAAGVSFGQVAPSGSPYAVPAAVAFTVRSNVPWNVLASARPPRLAGGTAQLPSTEYREGAAEYVPFPSQPSVIAAGQPTAGETHVHDYRQQIPFGAPPGRYAGTVTYEALAR